jgi:hypothetical protein
MLTTRPPKLIVLSTHEFEADIVGSDSEAK